MFDGRTTSVLEYHHSMITDAARTHAYHLAIDATVKPGDVVLDIGTGTGLLAMLAARAGAAHVYAIERGDVADAAEKLIAANGMGDRITVIRGLSTLVTPPARANVLVTETIGNMAYDESILQYVLDARARLLHDDARIIPHSIALCLAPIELPVHERVAFQWPDMVEGISYAAMQPHAANHAYRRRIAADWLLGSGAECARTELSSFGSPAIAGVATTQVERDGRMDALGVWFHAQLTHDIRLTTRPPNAAPSWHHAIMPFVDPIDVKRGDVVRMSAASPDGDIWQWRADVMDETDEPRVRREGSTFFGFPVSAESFRQQTDSYIPAEPRLRDAALLVLGHADGQTPIAEVSAALMTAHAPLFANADVAAAFARNIMRVSQ